MRRIDLRWVAKDVILPLLIALVPFSSNIYEVFTATDLHFVYGHEYVKNPVIEWNRQIAELLRQIGAPSKGADIIPPDLLLRRIGKEIYEVLPAMLSGIGFKPMDKKIVRIFNVSGHDIRNVRVHFIGCRGFDSYETWPDTFASADNKNISALQPTDTVTIRYDRLRRSPEHSLQPAIVVFFGADASQCRPLVEADLAKGATAVGKEVDLQSYFDERALDRYNKERLGDLAFKIFLGVAVLYMYFQIRSLRKRIPGG